MTTLAKFKDGNLYLKGEVNERLPLVTNGLVAHFPFDGTIKGLNLSPILDYSTWQVGTSGSQIGFDQNGSTNENYIVEGLDPFGKSIPLWEARPIGDNNADGGWNTSLFPIDNTKLYRFSVWVKRKLLGNGSFYLGCYGYDSSGNNVGVYDNANGTANYTDPYFSYGAWNLNIDEWVLVVGHAFPFTHTDTTMHQDSGYYSTSGAKIATCYRDYRWKNDNTHALHRSYLYYSTDTTTKQQWCYPRVDVCDGSEPTIEDLILGINGTGNVINPLTNTTVITRDGVAIEGATTNLVQNSNFKKGLTGWSEWVSYSNTIHPEIVDDPLAGTICRIRNDCGTGSINQTISGIQPYTTYTISYFIRINKVAPSYNYLYYVYNDGANGEYHPIIDGLDTTKIGLWQYVKGTFTTPAIGTDHFDGDIVLAMRIHSPEGTYSYSSVDFAYIQLEQSGFHTTWVDGSRPFSDSLYYPYSLIDCTTDFTICGWWYPKTCADGTYRPCLSRNRLSSDYTYKRILIMPENTASYRLSCWHGSDGATESICYAPSSLPIILNEWNFFILKREGVNMVLGIGNSGGFGIGTPTATAFQLDTAEDAATWGWMMGKYSTAVSNALLKDYSFYQRALSNSEIEKLFKGTFTITDKGDLIAREISEISNGIPNDCYYASLGADTIDMSGHITASSEAHTVYEDSGVWVGTAITNLILNPTFGTTSNWLLTTNGTGAFTVNGEWGKINVPAGETGKYYHLYQSLVRTTPANQEVTFSVIFKNNVVGRFALRLVMFVGVDAPQQPLTEIVLDGKGGTKRCSVTGSHAADSDQLRFDILTGSYYTAYGGLSDVSIEFTNAQAEEYPFTTPFTSTSRDVSDLEFNLNTSIGLDWNSNWSLVYWKKPVGTYGNSLTGYSLESLGCNSNSVGGGYIWWGKTNGLDEIASSYYYGSPVFAPTDYFNKWQLVSLVKNDTTLIIKTWLSNGAVYIRTEALGIVSANSFVTQYGYDLKLGGYDSTKVCNTYFRDLIIVKRALSDAELDVIYGTFGRAYKLGSFQIQGKIYEYSL